MTIVGEKINAPRPIQRPSDVERRPIDFGIEPAPPPPPKPEATIIKSAVQIEELTVIETTEVLETPIAADEKTTSPEPIQQESEEEWGEGIL